MNLQFMQKTSFSFISSVCQKLCLSWAFSLRRDIWFCISINEMICDNLLPTKRAFFVILNKDNTNHRMPNLYSVKENVISIYFMLPKATEMS